MALLRNFVVLGIFMALLVSCDSGSTEPSDGGITLSSALESSSSSAEQLSSDVEPCSSEIVSSSSLDEVSSSAMESSSSRADEFIWDDNRTNEPQVVKRFSGDSSDVQKSGRVFVAFDDTTEFNEFVESLGVLGIRLVDSINTKRDMFDIYLTKFDRDIPKTTLAEVIPGFFNSFNADDTTKINVYIPYEHLKENGAFDEDLCGLSFGCWGDISNDECHDVRISCDDGEPGVSMKHVDCLASHKDVLELRVNCMQTD